MFGFSFLKFVVLISVILTVLYGMLRMQRYFEIRNARMWGRGLEEDKSETAPGASSTVDPAAGGTVEETVRCPVCKFYVAIKHATKCDRANCPY